MSNLKKLVVSLELAKKLKELGCPQDSVFSWFEDRTNLPEINYFVDFKDANVEALEICSAFLSGELWKILPAWLNNDNTALTLTCDKSENTSGIFYSPVTGTSHYYQADKNLAEAMGKMLCYLIENDLWSKKEKN